MLAGVIIYESHNIKSTFENFNAGYRSLSVEGLPLQLTVQQLVVNSPFGRVMALSFMWSAEDVATGLIWRDKFETLGTVMMNTVAVRTIPDWLSESTASIPTSVHGLSRTHNLREMSDDVSAIICSALEKMPSDPGTMFSIHQLRGSSASKNSGSVFGSRVPHFMLEILGFATIEENRDNSIKWATETWEAINQMDNGTVLPQAYISLDHLGLDSDRVPLSRTYGSNDEVVLALKREYDQMNIFDLSVPRLKDYL